MVHAIFTYNFVQLHKPDLITNQVREALRAVFKLNKKETSDCNMYGLSGSGLQIRNSFIKVMFRLKNYAKLVKLILIPYLKQLKPLSNMTKQLKFLGFDTKTKEN